MTILLLNRVWVFFFFLKEFLKLKHFAYQTEAAGRFGSFTGLQRTYRNVNYKVGQGRASEAHEDVATIDRFVQKVLEVQMFPVGCRKGGQQFLSTVTSQHNMLWRDGRGGPFQACRSPHWEKLTHHLSYLSLDKDKRCPKHPYGHMREPGTRCINIG